MNFVDNLIIFANKTGFSQTFYYGFFGIGFVVAYGFLIWYGKKIELKTAKTIISIVLGSALVLCIMGLVQKVLSPLEEIFPIMNSYLNNMGRGFVFVPLIALAVSASLKIRWEKVSNLYAFTQTIIWGFASLGCLFPGCCRGYPCEWGIYNVRTETRLFPTQIINSIALLSVAVYIYIRCKRRNFKPDGTEYPIVLMLVGTIRFLTEFLMDNEKIILGLSSLSFDALLMFVVGLVLLIILNKKETTNE